MIVKKFQRKVWGGLIAVERDTEGARAQLTNGAALNKRQKMATKVAEKAKNGAKKFPERRQQNCPKTVWSCSSSQQYADWVVELSCPTPFFGSEFNNLQQYLHNLFVGAAEEQNTKLKNWKYKFGLIRKIL